MDALIQRLPSPLIAIPLLVLIASSLYNRLTALSKVPEGVPWVGKDPSKFFAGTRAFLASFTGVREWLASGYDKVIRLSMLCQVGPGAVTLTDPRSSARTTCPISCLTPLAVLK